MKRRKYCLKAIIEISKLAAAIKALCENQAQLAKRNMRNINAKSGRNSGGGMSQSSA